MFSPTVTVICTCYNHEKYVFGSLLSVKNQSYKNIQLIIVDNASTDNSVSMINSFISEYPDTLFIQNTDNIGLNKSFNIAVRHAKGKYLIDLAADDELTEERVYLQVAKFEKLDPKYGLMYSNVEEVDENGNHLRYSLEKDKTYRSGNVFIDLLKNHFIPSPSTIFKKEVFEKVGRYNEQLAFEDFDFWVKCAHQFDFYYLPIISTKKRILKNSLSAFFLSPTKSAIMLESTLETFSWAHNYIFSTKDKKDYNKGISYYYRQSVVLGHFELAIRFKKQIFQEGQLKSNLIIFFLAKGKINISKVYVLYKKLMTY